MQFDEIIKDTNFSDADKPNLIDYSKQYNDFDWNRDAYSKLEWLPDGGLNNAYECVDKHVKNGYGDNLAMIWLGKNGEEENYSYTDFKNESDKFGQVMLDLGMQKGDRVFIFMDRLPEPVSSMTDLLSDELWYIAKSLEFPKSALSLSPKWSWSALTLPVTCIPAACVVNLVALLCRMDTAPSFTNVIAVSP